MKAIHIGFPKTATTFLQNRVFTRLAGELTYIDKRASAAFFRPLLNHDDTLYDGADLEKRLGALCPRGRRALFSYEGLTGLHHHCAFVNRSSVARRLHALGFERVLITIRNQIDVLESAYKQYVKSGGTLPLRDYLCFDDSRPRLFYVEYFDYEPIYRLYAQLFGPSNVLVLQHERLLEPTSLSALFDFLGVTPVQPPLGERVNTSLSSSKTRVLRILNHFTYSAMQPSHWLSRKISTAACYRALAALPVGNGGGSLLDARLRDEIARFFHERNRRLEAKAGIVLTPEYP